MRTTIQRFFSKHSNEIRYALLMMCIGMVSYYGLSRSLRSAGAQTTTPSSSGRLLASNCFQCHNTNGRSIGGMDSIAGKSAKSIFEELKEMQQKPANQNIMNVHARGYTDQQLKLLADFLSRQ